MVEQVTLFRTADGKEFESEALAKGHEAIMKRMERFDAFANDSGIQSAISVSRARNVIKAWEVWNYCEDNGPGPGDPEDGANEEA